MKSIFFSSLYLLTEFLISRFIFEPANLFYEIWWLDIPMHILGGFGVAWFATSIARYVNKEISYSAVIMSLLIIAIVWEVYEYIRSVMSFQPWSGWFDTVKDLVDGILGASLWYYLYKK